jgi:molybdate transport system substrate-binding protein
LVAGLLLAAPARAEPLTVYAAASATEIMTELARRFEADAGTPVRLSFAASSVLARQIANGAPADVFLSADVAWMDHLEAGGAIDAASRRDLLGNRLVLIASRSSAHELKLEPGAPLVEALGNGFLAMGDPAHVPAGRYGREALQAFGIWRQLQGRLAYAASVREALALVARGEAVLAITYATDAPISEAVRVVAVFPRASHAPIVYPVALVAGSTHPAAGRFLDFLDSKAANTVYRRFGFEPTGSAGRE